MLDSGAVGVIYSKSLTLSAKYLYIILYTLLQFPTMKSTTFYSNLIIFSLVVVFYTQCLLMASYDEWERPLQLPTVSDNGGYSIDLLLVLGDITALPFRMVIIDMLFYSGSETMFVGYSNIHQPIWLICAVFNSLVARNTNVYSITIWSISIVLFVIPYLLEI